MTSRVVKLGESRMLVLMVFSWEIMRRVIYFDGMILVESKCNYCLDQGSSFAMVRSPFLPFEGLRWSGVGGNVVLATVSLTLL